MNGLTRRSLAGGGMLLLAMLASMNADAAEPAPVVVELFTSQGCSSCPPADQLLGELAQRDDLLALSFHVTYWDRLGWPDTLGLEAGTRRQERYASTLGLGRMYTPQMVIQGRIDVVGSARARVLQALDLIAGHRDDGVTLAVEGDRLAVAGVRAPATVWLAAYDRVERVAIERGENRGRTLTYHNAVGALTELGRLDGGALELTLPLARMRADGRDGAAVWVQRDRDGAILTAARVDLPAGQTRQAER